MKTNELVELGNSAVNILEDLTKAAGHVERIVKIVKQDKEAWSEVRKHFMASSHELDKVLTLRGLLNEE